MAADEVRYAGFWLRCWAFLLDSVCLVALLLPAVLAVYGFSYFTAPDGWFRGPADIFIQIFLPFILVFWFWRKWLATPGKMLLGSKIVDAQSGGDPSGMQLLIRYLGYFVSLIPFGLGFLWVAVDRRKQGWHDKMAGTAVVLTAAETSGRAVRLLVPLTAISVAATVLTVGAGGVWLWWNQELLVQSGERAGLAHEEGIFWGIGGSAQRCLPRALERLDACQGYLCGYRESLFVAGCLSASRDLDVFCHDVPSGLGALLSVGWQRERCQESDHEGLACLQIMSAPIGICRQLRQRPAEGGERPGFVR